MRVRVKDGEKYRFTPIGSEGKVVAEGDDKYTVNIDYVPGLEWIEKLPKRFNILKCDVEEIRDTSRPLPDVEWEDCILPEEVKEEIWATISTEVTKQLLKWGFGKGIWQISCTVLLWGKPGVGKTLFAQACARRLEKPLIVLNSVNLQSHLVGVMEKNVAAWFQKARNQDLILFFDEAESLLSSRRYMGSIQTAETNTLLDEIEQHHLPLFFATNQAPNLDEALERRIVCKVHIKPPSEEAREKIWQKMILPTMVKENSVKKLARELSSFKMTGGQIRNAVLQAARRALRLRKEIVALEDLIASCEAEITETTIDTRRDSFRELNFSTEILDGRG